KKVAQIRSDKRNPDGDEAALERNAFGDQINGKPVGDEEIHRIGKRAANDGAPGLRQLQQVAPARGPSSGGSVFAPVRKNHVAFPLTYPRMFFGAVVQATPDD